jgi:hypothetical protein
VIDLDTGSWRQQQTQARRSPSPNTAPVTYSFGVDGTVAYLVDDDDGAVSREPALVASERRAELHILALLRIALAPDATLINARTHDHHDLVDVVTHDGTFTLYPITGNIHAASMVMVYLPRARILVTVDLFDRSSSGKFPFAANLVENVRRRKLSVERMVGLHGRPVLFAEVIAAAGASSM